MNKKDYIKLAQAIKENSVEWSQYHMIEKWRFITALCDILAADNKKFDKVKFMEAIK